jgi:hypothetical protein
MDRLKQFITDNREKLDAEHLPELLWEDLKLRVSEDPLKVYLKSNAGAMDVDFAPENGWQAIEKKLEPRFQIRSLMQYAAAACILVLIGFGIARLTGSSATKKSTGLTIIIPKPDTSAIAIVPVRPDSIIAAPKKKKIKISLPGEVLQLQQDYAGIINKQISYVRQTAIYSEDAYLFNGIVNDLKDLDEQEKELRRSIIKNGLQENSIGGLSMIYQQKLMVLKSLLREMDKSNMRNKETSGKDYLKI